MARISGVNIPTNKKVNIALTYIFGIGKKFALDICKNASIDISKRVSELNEEEVNKIRDLIDKDYSFHLKNNSADLITRIRTDSSLIRDTISALFNFFQSIIFISGILVFLIFFTKNLTILDSISISW